MLLGDIALVLALEIRRQRSLNHLKRLLFSSQVHQAQLARIRELSRSDVSREGHLLRYLFFYLAFPGVFFSVTGGMGDRSTLRITAKHGLGGVFVYFERLGVFIRL
jgi:hypothetical protein